MMCLVDFMYFFFNKKENAHKRFFRNILFGTSKFDKGYNTHLKRLIKFWLKKVYVIHETLRYLLLVSQYLSYSSQNPCVLFNSEP